MYKNIRGTINIFLVYFHIYNKYATELLDVFSGVYVLEGEGLLNDNVIKSGSQIFLPANLNEIIFTNTGEKPLKIVRFFGRRFI